MKRLIIAEKPSLGKNIANAIGKASFINKDGYMESNEYIVTWAYGHLFTLKDIEEYTTHNSSEETLKWTLTGLPFKPTKFGFTLKKQKKGNRPDAGVKKQFNIIKSLCSRSDVEYIINAGDADREGEIIIRLILDAANNRKEVLRLWLPEQTSATIQRALENLESDALYNNLADEGYARTYIDWLYGINLTRLATIKSGKLLRVGRVIVPTVKAIYDRDMEIRNFKPEKYWVPVSKLETKGVSLELSSKEKFSSNQEDIVKEFCHLHNLSDAIVKDKEIRKVTVNPGKLFSLSTLQGVLGSQYKMSPKESLSIIQQLYESGYITYPRTNTEYLACAEKNKINTVIKKLQNQGFAVMPKDNNKSIYDDSKIISHSALTPTYILPSQNALTENQWKVYSTILNRFLAVFCSEPCVVNRTQYTIDIGDRETFKISGDVLIEKGWMMYEKSSKKDKVLPELNVNEKIDINFMPVLKETTAPSHYNVKTLADYMKNPFRKDKSIEDNLTGEVLDDAEIYKSIVDGAELGTEATRTGIIDTAIKSGYISLKNNVYTILPAGEYYIETLEKMGLCLTKEKTIELGKSLKRVYRGEETINQSIDYAFNEIQSLFNYADSIKVSNYIEQPDSTDEVGICPKCGNPVTQKEKGFYCINKNCSFGIRKDDKFFSSIGKKPTKTIIKGLLKNKKAALKDCTSKKTGKKFDCTLCVDFSEKYPKYSLEFKH